MVTSFDSKKKKKDSENDVERERERERERSRTKIEDYHFINSFNQLLRIAMDKGIAWGLTRKERRENKR